MSIAQAIFSKGTIKLIVALGIPVGIAWLFVYSQQQANVEVTKYKQEQKEHPTAERITVNNYSIKEVDDANRIRWQLVARKGIVGQSNQEVELQEVKVEYFDGPVLKARLIAPAGMAQESTRYVKLQGSPREKVIAEGQEGKAKLEAPLVELTKKNQFRASGGVTIEWPGVAKVTGSSASGTIDLADMRHFKIVGNTHAEIVVK